MGSLCAKPKETVAADANMSLENGNEDKNQKTNLAPYQKETVFF